MLISIHDRLPDTFCPELWRGLPDDVKGLLVSYLDKETRRVLPIKSHKMHRWLENSIQKLVIWDVKALDLLKDSARFINCHTVYFGCRADAQQLRSLRASICGIEPQKYRLKNDENAAMEVLLARPWETLKLGKLHQDQADEFSTGNDLGVDVEIVPRILKLSQSTLTCLNLDHCFIDDAGAGLLSKAVKLEVLSLKKSQIGNVGASEIATLPRLRKLLISEGSMQAEGMLALLGNASLTVLALEKIDLGRAERPVWNALSQHPSLTELNVKGSLLQASPSVIDLALKALAENSLIRKLCLSGNNIFDTDMRYIASMPALVDLDVSSTRLRQYGLSTLAKNSGIKKLDLSENCLTLDDLKPLLDVGKVESLKLFDCSLKEDSLAEIWINKSLKELEIGMNFTADTILKYLAKPASPNLQKVSVNLRPILGLEEVGKFVSKGVTVNGMEFHACYTPNNVAMQEYKLSGIAELQAMRYVIGFESIRRIFLEGTGFSGRNLRLLPEEMEVLTLSTVGFLSVDDLAPLASRPLLELNLSNMTLDEEGLRLLMSLGNLDTLRLYRVPLNAGMRAVLYGRTHIQVSVTD